MLDVRSVSVYFSIFYFKRDVLMDPALVKILVSDRIRGSGASLMMSGR